jgi:hypothetical protein
MCKCYRWLRHPKTTQERRRNANKEEKQFVRAKRSSNRNLPTAWDDIPISRKWRNESWKRLRQTQYRTKAGETSCGNGLDGGSKSAGCA